MSETQRPLQPGANVRHIRHGIGLVMLTDRDTAVVRFTHGIEQVLSSELLVITSLDDAIRTQETAPSLEVALRVQAAAIRSVNDAWGVFTRSRISLLPHQLWVCHRALKTWPIRLLIADDVGMGKTIEAGLILWPLLANRTVQRLLILAPAKLVEQWQQRLKKMFDIRAAVYHPDLDTKKSDFWGIHQIVIASLPTLRADHKGRHERLLEAPQWDMLIVDEAHHLNAEEGATKTQGFELVEKLRAAGKTPSCVLFSGTPHRGKAYGFWSLMGLLDPQVFGPKRNEGAMLGALPRFLIRNAKQKATDMKGNRLFMPIEQYPETFTYSPEEESFYELMSSFIMAGKAYASSLGKVEGGQVMLVLIALQKLASSSVAAVLAALETRRGRLVSLAAKTRAELESQTDDPTTDEGVRVFEEWLRDEKRSRIQLMEDEGRHLDDLLASGRVVLSETRVVRVMEVISSRFADQPVLLFSEYKRTQALVVSALMERFGSESVGFINGDNRLDAVRHPDGRLIALSARREDTCDAFNAGRLRFLVSTEAGGEGIDLQERCSALIHVDLPWNPMRLHQRVGRLNRYGQTKPVRVVSLRNPDTVESMIWAKLESKLNSIMRAIGSAMDEPEDLMQLVLGMSAANLFDGLFSGAVGVGRERLGEWFDLNSGTLGGEAAIKAVQDLVGHAQSFDLSDLKDVPPLDLPDLLPFFENCLVFNRRRPKVEGLALSFKTPEEWLTTLAIKKSYENLVFDRKASPSEGELMGVGHPLMEKALHQSERMLGSFCLVGGLEAPLLVVEISSRVTDMSMPGSRIVAAVTAVGDVFELRKDWEVLRLLRSCSLRPDAVTLGDSAASVTEWVQSANAHVQARLADLKLPFGSPQAKTLAVFWPS
ncbi:DEAD/DEAH box helicase [Hydrogenophaga sp. RWCD_12]|uniref:DEAD/DEAH box helicase n=1 Tax=Hydrogenophaga sp. RWCD_12 TaxID=3391190 RepID=UPI003985552B